MESMVFHALLEKYTIKIASCISALVIHKDTHGAPAAFCFANTFGKVPFSAAAAGISAAIMVQASHDESTAISNPQFINTAPHGPTTFSNTPAVDGLATAAISACVKKPNGKIFFTGSITDKVAKGLGRIIDNKKVQNFALKYQGNDKDIAKHITAATDTLLTATAVVQTNKSTKIKENRKQALNYNNIISTVITIVGGYFVDGLIKKPAGKFVEKFKKLNAGNPNLAKCVEGINILRPAIIFATIYYGVLPVFSTYLSEKTDKYIVKHKK